MECDTRNPVTRTVLVFRVFSRAVTVLPWKLRNDASQEALAELAASPLMHLTASIDHVNAPLVWDVRLVAKFNGVRGGGG